VATGRPPADTARPAAATGRPLDPARLGDHLDRLYRVAWGFTGNPHDAEDLVQEMYARVLSRPRRLRGGDELGYLIVALRNTYFAKRQRDARRPQTGPILEALDLADLGAGRDPVSRLEAGELYAAVASLPRDYREVLVAVDVGGLAYKEAAAALRVPLGTVMSRLFRARKQVARHLEGEPGGE